MTDCMLENEFLEQKERLSRAIKFAMTDKDKMSQRKGKMCPLENNFVEIYSTDNPRETENRGIYNKHIQNCSRCFYVSNLLFWLRGYINHISIKFPRLREPKTLGLIIKNTLNFIQKESRKPRGELIDQN